MGNLRFLLSHVSCVHRQINEAFKEKKTIPAVKQGGGSVIVQGLFGLESVQDTMKSQDDQGIQE